MRFRPSERNACEVYAAYYARNSTPPLRWVYLTTLTKLTVVEVSFWPNIQQVARAHSRE